MSCDRFSHRVYEKIGIGADYTRRAECKGATRPTPSAQTLRFGRSTIHALWRETRRRIFVRSFLTPLTA